ncbi:MAG: efflux RND transporter periplasmic adaptor subunit [Ignavibacteria bacterium]|nr:efflux RND transporter periplasmic adaptor subunit [Ignavibacteria bacterium]MBT8381863.1 efflux RND transporter periplasmic adaptor subunit [Ignavibacteria bacterium]MBT8393201.1 efflux RND transporter periplasmic adaptor subunit [Ignavibacteria bacterium]NNJ52385.1 HlyD family efflux transporter periplasmic adaptor subunit [Ignavibacteriaceae bacterium]NNL21827.1 HlyD family efflux transporter periplasmic adaptor subunit [Ignavibacteriaceae bacterium]
MKKVLASFSIVMMYLLLACNGNNEGNIEASGNIEATNIIISSQVTGEVLQIIKDEGAKVSAGDTIIIIDPETYELKLQEVLAVKDAAEAQLNLLKKGARSEDVNQAEENQQQAKIGFELAKKDKERMENLYQSQTITKKQYDDAVANYEINLARLNAAKENLQKIKNLSRPEELKQAEANLNRAIAIVNLIKKNLNDCYITSPSSGFITQKFIEKGETAGMMSSLFQVADLSTVEIVIYIRETELGKVKLGQNAEISVDTYPDKSYTGKVIYISPEAEFTPKNIQTQEERTKLVFAVKIKIDNSNFELKDGMPADAVIIL